MRFLFRDLRHALRLVGGRPALALAVIATLGSGIGLSTAIATVVHALLVRPLPFPAVDRLVLVREVDAAGRVLGAAEPTFDDIAARSHSFHALAYTAGSFPLVVTGGREPVRARVSYASARVFDVLGVRPLVGRTFLDEETRYGGPVAALVSHGFWQRALGGRRDPGAAPLIVDGIAARIVGVMPPRFDYPVATDVWLTRSAEPPATSRRSHGLTIIGRLRDDVSPTQAQAELSAIAGQLRGELGEATDAVDFAIVSPQAFLTRHVSDGLWLLLGAVALLLLAACANVSNLLLAQFADRRRELAVRRTLGATRRTLAWQITLENLTMTLPAAALGAGLAEAGVGALAALAGDRLPMIETVAVDARVLLSVVALAVIIAVALAVLPLSTLGHEVAAVDLRGGGRGLSADRRARGLRQALLVAQVSVTVVLLVCAGLLGRGFLALVTTDPGFRTEHAIAMTLALPSNVTPEGEARLRQFYGALLDRLAALPGVRAVGGINTLPLTGQGASGAFQIEERPDRRGVASYRVASAGYFGAMGIPLRRGRLFDRGDRVDGPHVAVISESLARQSWPGEDPIGQRLQFGNMDTDRRLLHIVGVVADVKSDGLDAEPRPTVYAYSPQRPQWWQAARLSIVVRTDADPAALAPAMRAAVEGLRADVPLELRTMRAVAAASLTSQRFTLVLFAVFSGAALLIAALGVWAAVACGLAQRTREIGIRVALGASRTSIVALVVRQGMTPVLVGMGVGLAAAALAARLMGTLVHGVSASDPLTFATVTLVLALVGAAACWAPARRAVTDDPLAAMRAE
jgi:putative ABC transport system permease protein